ncbi:MAG TPA: kelch repeat-containing protein, partial [Chryseolinea sp.]
RLVGNHFATEPGKNVVMFGNTPTYIISESKTEIEVAVPDAETRTPTITVTSYGSSVSISAFTMKSPVISDFSPHRGQPTDQLIITGTSFRGSYLKVFLDDVQLQLDNMDDTHLYTRIPYDLTKHEGTLKVRFYDQEFVLGQTFKSPWIRIDDFPGTGLTSSQTFVHNNAAYVALVGNGTNNEVWKFSNNQWSQLNDFPGIDPGSSLGSTFSFIVGGKGYIGGGDIDVMQRSNKLWEYDVVTDSWTKITDIPQSEYVFSGFAVGSTGFAFEQDFVTQPKLWEYNAAADTWSMISVVPDGMSGTANSFIIGNTAYLLDQQWQAFWKYVPSSNQWTAVSVPDNFKFAFSMGGFGYAGNRYSFYKFNPSTNAWSQELMPYPYLDDDNFISFSINGKGYIVRRSSGTYGKVAYEYDPSF